MDLLQRIITCSDDEVNLIIEEAIKEKNATSEKVEKLGFTSYGKSNYIFKGFIGLDTRIKYANLNMEDYGMQTTDFFYDFAHFVKKYNIKSKGELIHYLEYFIINYFGYPSNIDRETIFNDIAWKTTTTDEEYFNALKNNKIGDLKGKGAAECTERGALAQQILSLFDIETYYCTGCVDLGEKQDAHCFNIVKTKNNYALLDYSIPITSYNKDGKIAAYYPFIGTMSNEEFLDFTKKGTIKSFQDYCYKNKNTKEDIQRKRKYVVGKYEIEKQDKKGNIR